MSPRDGMDLLDLGCGWGSVALFMAARCFLWSMMHGNFSLIHRFIKLWALTYCLCSGSQAAESKLCPTRTSRENISRSRPGREDSPTSMSSLAMLQRSHWYTCSVHIFTNSKKTQMNWIVDSLLASRNQFCQVDPEEFQDAFDRVISIEMFEHMKNYGKLHKKVSTCLVLETCRVL